MTEKYPRGANSNRHVSTVVVAALLTCSSSPFPLKHWRNHRQGVVGFGGNFYLHLSSSSHNVEHDGIDDSIQNDVSGDYRQATTRRKPIPNTDNSKNNNINMYQVLGANPSMSRAEIKRLYFSLAKELHPDANNQRTDDVDRFNEIAQAWSILSDSKTRRAHDRQLAAQDFKDDIVRKASEVAKEYGPVARKFYDDVAIPLLRRTTATTIAGLSAMAEEVVASEKQQQGEAATVIDISGEMSLSAVASGGSEMKRVNTVAGDAFEDFGRVFQRVMEASKNATRQIDGLELREKSLELKQRADEAQNESVEILKQLTEIRMERLRLTFHSSLAEFTSSDVIQYLNGSKNTSLLEQMTFLQRMTFKHPLKQDIEAFAAAEADYDFKVREKMDIDEQCIANQRAVEEAENFARLAAEDEERIRAMLEVAQRRVADSQKVLIEAQKTCRDFDVVLKKADQEVSRASIFLKRKRNIVRQELKRKSINAVDGSMFEQIIGNGKNRINPGYDRTSLNMIGFEEQTLATIESLLRDERRIEGDFMRLVDKSSRLVSRSERLRIRSEDLIGEQISLD